MLIHSSFSGRAPLVAATQAETEIRGLGSTNIGFLEHSTNAAFYQQESHRKVDKAVATQGET